MIGSYFLVIKNNKDQIIKIGKLGKIFFKKGFYVYIGSALNGLEQRISRHLIKNKKIYWHIDYLLEKTKIIKIFYKESYSKEECEIALNFKKKLRQIPRFGCTDCKCKSHLFYGEYKDIIEHSKSLNFMIYNKS